jgi:glycosyltransferase involved in cell wall biosynthesis
MVQIHTRNTTARGPESPLNILVLAPLPFLRNGVRAFAQGGPIFNAQLLSRIAALGHRVRVITDAPAAKQGEVRTGLQWDLPTLTIEWFVSEFQSSFSPPSAHFRELTRHAIAPVFDRLVAEERPDVVLMGRDIMPVFMLDGCRHHQLPTVVISHSQVPTALVRGLYPDDAARELIGCFNEVEVVVAIAGHVEAMLRKLGVARVVTIRNVVDTHVFRPQAKDVRLLQELNLSPTQPIVGHVSALRPAKRARDIVEAAVAVLRSRPDVAFVIVGDGVSRRELVDRAAQLGVLPNFRFVGEIVHGQVPRYVNLCDLLVLPSEREGLPLVSLEAQACGRAMLSSDIPGAREIITDGGTGMLFRTGDVGELAAKILVLINDCELRQTIGRRARTFAEQRPLSEWTQAYLNVLRRAAQRGFSTGGS